VADEQNLPVAIRVARPYGTEDELLHSELETLTRTSITLLGAQSRPPGLVLRFELVLSTGQTLLRGEGRVVGYKSGGGAHDGMGGLTLRFTRLDSRSKALVDKAAALREQRRPTAGPVPPEPLSLPAPPIRIEDPAESMRPRAPSVPEEARSTAAGRPAREAAQATPVPRDRDALLERLRVRSKTLPKRA
jgi:hypothetical protein